MLGLVPVFLMGFTPLVCVPPFGSVDALTAPVTGQTFTCTSVWDTTDVANGPHTLTIRAYDRAGNMAEHSITVTVLNPPARPTGLGAR